MTVIAIILLIYIASFIFIRVRNADPLGWKRQLSDFSTFVVPLNIPIYLLSKIPLTPFLNKKYFPHIKILEDNWETIRDEALKLYENGFIKTHGDLPGSSFYKNNRWTSFYLKVYETEVPSAKKLAPKTMELIEQIPNMNLALFACLNPGKQLSKHHDPFALSVRYSLGLSTPNSDKCALVVDGEHCTWRDGEGILFDETYAHYTYNEADTPRIILMTDLDRPLKLKFVQKFYYHFAHFFNRLFFTDNVDPSITGIGNKITPYHKKFRQTMQRFKDWNKPLYRITTKYIPLILVFVLLYFIFR